MTIVIAVAYRSTHMRAVVPAVMGRFIGLSFLVVFTLACDGTRDRPSSVAVGSDGGTAPAPLGAATLGDECIAACGSADDRKCSSSTAECPLCLIDPGHARLTYCTQDCTRDLCPTGWTCEPIKAFGQDLVSSACVADTAVCGDAIRQLGELCDGDDPAFGRCVDCASWVAECGDGIVQASEVCDGDDPQLGECFECQQWRAVCGDGVVQAPEVCDGNEADRYCEGCTTWRVPTFDVTVRMMSANAVERQDGNTTWYYSLGAEAGALSLTIPTAGDADGCGGIEVLESTGQLTRFSWVVCNEWGKSTWRIALPRTVQSYSDFDGAIPDAFGASVLVESRDGSYRLEWTMTHMASFEVRAFAAEDPGFSQGSLRFRLRQQDPLASFNQAEAEIDLNFQILHPVL